LSVRLVQTKSAFLVELHPLVGNGAVTVSISAPQFDQIGAGKFSVGGDQHLAALKVRIDLIGADLHFDFVAASLVPAPVDRRFGLVAS
jgi:hypothetical protein